MQDGIFVDVPGLGEGYVTAGVDFFTVRFGCESINTGSDRDTPSLTINGRSYMKVDVQFNTVGEISTVSSSFVESLTHPARNKIRRLVEKWAKPWTQTGLAASILAKTVRHYNAINESRIQDEIISTRAHLAELELLAAKIRSAGPTEYVTTYNTTYELILRRS